jgi:two-component system, NtrC family, sensor histidine kinase PilS
MRFVPSPRPPSGSGTPQAGPPRGPGSGAGPTLRVGAPPTHAARGCPGATRSHGADPVHGLRTLICGRLVVAALALPLGLLLQPEKPPNAGTVFMGAGLAIALLSVVYELAARSRRALTLQVFFQMSLDLALVTLLATQTGGCSSQFILFYVLVVLTGGLLARLPGGVFAAVGAGAGYVLLPALTRWLGGMPDGLVEPALPASMLLTFVVIVGVLAGALGRRVRAAHDDLERTTRELDRVRVDNDVILRHLATGVLTVDARGTVAYLNPAAEQVLGLRTAELRGRVVDEAFPERLRRLGEAVRETLDRGTTRARLELTARTERDEELVLGVTTNVLRHEGTVTGVVAVFQDLTNVRDMERRARRNETLAEVGALAAGIAHELRNGLKPISGSVEYLQRELQPEGENAVLMGLIVRECTRLNRFVTDLLNYARERDLVMEPLDLRTHLAELCETVRLDPRCGSLVRVVCAAPEEDVRLRGDREQLWQVWLNLVNNSLDAMAGGGTLTVRWRPAPDGRAVVEFVDEGSGMSPEHLPRVGEPFFTTKPGGTGLGVAIAQRIVERHGGTLAFESAPGRGTVARVCLPAENGILAEAA